MAQQVAPRQLVAGIPRIPLEHGLFSVLAFRPDADRWMNGVKWESETCDDLGRLGAWFCAGDEEDGPVGLPKSLEPNAGAVGEADPFSVYGHYACSAMSRPATDMQDLANRHLFTREEAAVEETLWSGDLGNTPNFSGANGFDLPEDLGDYALADIWKAISKLEAHIAKAYGGQGVLHMSRFNASMATDKSVAPKGGVLRTPMGTPIVAGTGYGDEKIVVTSPLLGYRSEPFVPSNSPYDLLDRGNNDLVAVTERQYLVGFDPCGLAQATIIA